MTAVSHWLRRLVKGISVVGALALTAISTQALGQEQPRVVLFDDAVRPTLCGALRIQLADVAQVDCLSDVDGDTLQARIQAAVAQLSQQDAQLGVFLERGETELRMYLVAGRNDEAVLAVESIRDRPAPDLDRSLALKVRDAIDSVRIAQEVASERNSSVSPLSTVALQPAAPVAPSKEPRWALWLEAGGGLRAPLRGQGQVALGLRRREPIGDFEVGVTARMFSALRSDNSSGRIDESEWSAGITLRALHHMQRVALGAVLETQLHIINARGTTSAGATGSALLALPSFALGLDGRVRLFEGAFLRFAPTFELMPIEQRFSLNQRVHSSLHSAHFIAPLSLLVQLPWSTEP